MMGNLKALMVIVAGSVIEFLRSQAIPTRQWAKPIWDGEVVSFQLIDTLDVHSVRGQVNVFLRQHESSRELVTAVLDDESLRARWLVDAAGNAITNVEAGVWWLEHNLMWPLIRDYLLAVQAIRFDEAAFASIFDQFLNELNQTLSMSTKLYPLLNAKLIGSDTDILPGVKLRKVQLSEYERWANPTWSMGERPLPFFGLQGIQCLIETSNQRDEDKAGQRGDVPIPGDEVVTAIRLLTGKRIHVAFMEERIPIGYVMGLQGGLPFLLRVDTPLELDDGLVRSLTELVQQLASSPNAGRLRVALRRWDSSFDRLRDEDRLLDYWIALESLFTPDSTQELSFRASLRIAAYLGQDSSRRKQIYDDVKTSYAFRSVIVHGSAEGLVKLEKKGRTLSEITSVTGHYLREAIRAILKEPGPFDGSIVEQGLLG